MTENAGDAPRIPTLLYVAALFPTLLAVGLRAVALLWDGAAAWSSTPVLVLGVALSFSLALLVAGLRSWIGAAPAGDRGSAALKEAIEALSQAQRFADEQRAAVSRIEVALQRSATPSAPGRRRPVVFLALLALGLLAGAAAGSYLGAAPVRSLAADNPVHVHAAYALYVDDERLRFKDASFDISSRGYMRAHLHAPDDEIIHVEGPPGTTLADFLANTLAIRFEDGGMRLDDAVHRGRWVSLEERSVRVYVAPEAGNWSAAPQGLSYAPRDHDRILILVGGAEATDREKQATVATEFPAS